jgi:DNA-binding SARP family transcriptional activator
LTLVIAEAGYGKTTLLADFSSRATARCLWYRLDPTDADPITWTNYLIAAVREVDPSFGGATQSLLAQIGPGGPPESAFASSFLGELPTLGEAPTILVLDDFQEVDASADARDYIARLLKDAPPWMHFVIAARRRPGLELARLAGRGDVAELSTDDLRFGSNETQELFTHGYGLDLDADVLEAVRGKTKGWAASLQLFQGLVHGRPASAIRAFAMSLSGADSPMYDFLAQEVLNNIDGDLEEFLLRSSLLDRVTAANASALFPDRRGLGPDAGSLASWIAECDQRGLLTKVSATSEARQLHPLLRDFLLRALSQRHSATEIKRIHASLAHFFEQTDPLAASLHYIEAGQEAEAMTCLERSTMLAMGSGRWGDASRLADRLAGVPAGPAVAAVKARRSLEEGDLEAASALLRGVDVSDSPPEIRASFRNAQLSLGWRSDDQDLMDEALRALQSDTEAPPVMKDIASIFIDASHLGAQQVSFLSLAGRLVSMSDASAAAGLQFFSAVSLHNATVAFLAGGDLMASVRTGESALMAFDELTFKAPEQFSTHSVLAVAYLELGNQALSDEHQRQALATGAEFADVSAELAMISLVSGDRKSGMAALARTEALLRQGRADAIGLLQANMAVAFSSLPAKAANAIRLLEPNMTFPVNFGEVLGARTLLSLAYLLAGDIERCVLVASEAIDESRRRLGRRYEARLRLILAIASEDPIDAANAVTEAALSGQLALLELADAVADHLDMFNAIPPEIEASVAAWPARWLPALRRQLEKGYSPTSRAAARLLDSHGEPIDIGLLRAFARTYRNRGRLGPLGVNLAHRVAPRLEVHDLGRVTFSIGGRAVELATIRRKPAALFMYLLTRPGFTANREQVLDELWPETDPNSASNSLNQSLYFLRREFDPWYEDDLSIDYVAVQGELVWLDSRLVTSDSAEFLAAAHVAMHDRLGPESALTVLMSYRGPFAPEFEYDDWAMSWRTKAHAAFLELSNTALDDAVDRMDLVTARDIATHALDVDSENRDLESKLIWLYWHMGSRAAASAQYQHLASRDRLDGLEPSPLQAIVSPPKPT